MSPDATPPRSVPRLPAVVDFLGSPRPLLIGGKWQPAQSGKTFVTVDPATGTPLARVAEGEAADIDAAVAAARTAMAPGSPWTRMTPGERERLLQRVADLVEKHVDELAQLESLDNGKALKVARHGDIPSVAACFRYMAGWASRLDGRQIPLVGSPPGLFHAFTLREPVGVVGAIIPWNFPLLMAAWKLAPALCCGNAVVLKPAEQTPLSALRLGELLCQAGLPDGVVNIVTGFGETAGAALAGHPQVDKVAFTGSTEVGRLIVRAAAGNLKKLTLELGGKSPNVVFADADLDPAIAGAANAIFFNQGQVCTAGSRLYVEEAALDRVLAGVAARASKIRLGPGMTEGTQMGPLVSAEQLSRVSGYVDSGRSEGARVVIGGGRHGDSGFFMQPTVLTDVRPSMRVVQEEIFGPVVTVHPFKSIEEVTHLANDTIYGLAAAVWSRDTSKAQRVAQGLKAGTVWINCYGAFDDALPFGGYKQSGWGREGGSEVLDAYTQTKTVVMKL
ncbi:MAG TPA: aldehyde dehydrogenase family protein [Pseudomonadota bacterium]|nr:aldehyde dehydrogenase family protein [Pseudomonadota bacterium]